MSGKKLEPRQWNSSLPRRKKGMNRSSIKRAKQTHRRPATPLGPGKRTKRRQEVVRGLKKVFQQAGITTCELGYLGCYRDNYLGFAHSLKSRYIQTDYQWEEVCLACNHCHDLIEGMSHGDMYAVVLERIAARKVPVKRIFDFIEDRR